MSKIKIYIFFYSLIIFISIKTSNEDYCQKIQCNSNLSPDTCIKVESTISYLKSCPDSKICNNPTEDPITDSYCIEKKEEIKFKKLPSLPCNNTNEECLSNTCMIDKCKGKDEGDACISASDCYYGKK